MFEHVTQNGTTDQKDKAERRNRQERNKRRCGCQENHVGGLCIRRMRCTSRGTVAGRTIPLAVRATLRPVRGEVKASWPPEGISVWGIQGTGYIIQPSTNATPTKVTNTLAPYKSRSRGVFLLRTPNTTETRKENRSIAGRCGTAILSPSEE